MIPAYLTDGTSTIIQRIVASAFKFAGERKHRTVSPSHVLKGLLLVPCRAQQVLRALLDGRAYENLERNVDASIEPGSATVAVAQNVSPKVDSIFQRMRVLAKNLGVSKPESIHLLLSCLLENDANPQVILTGAGITASMIIAECSKTSFQSSECEDAANEAGDTFSRLMNLLSATATQPSLLPDFITLCEKNGLWKAELLRPFYLFAATQGK